MEKLLYAEVYLICMLVVSLLLYWAFRKETRSASERWLDRALIFFLSNFAANFLYTLFSHVLKGTSLLVPVSYVLKSLYFILLDVGVFSWCCYGETELQIDNRRRKRFYALMAIPLIVPIVGVLMNFKTHNLFFIEPDTGAYRRRYMFHFHMLYLVCAGFVCSVRLIMRAWNELDPSKKSHLHLTAAFPLYILTAWMLSFLGESVPVICVSVMFGLLCLFIGANEQQISKDKLTQVNNRQNLIGFLNYKIVNHEEKIYLLMIDIDFFKTINDTYGHLEGDQALIFVSNVLKKACMDYKKRPYIARYGGDEFMVVLEGTRQDVNSLVENIRNRLKEDRPENSPYDVSLSIGMAEYQVGMQAKDLIAAADEEMYKIKKERHR